MPNKSNWRYLHNLLDFEKLVKSHSVKLRDGKFQGIGWYYVVAKLRGSITILTAKERKEELSFQLRDFLTKINIELNEANEHLYNEKLGAGKWEHKV